MARYEDTDKFFKDTLEEDSIFIKLLASNTSLGLVQGHEAVKMKRNALQSMEKRIYRLPVKDRSRYKDSTSKRELTWNSLVKYKAQSFNTPKLRKE
jgi:hypothetical protein